jgi:hypothetical protein
MLENGKKVYDMEKELLRMQTEKLKRELEKNKYSESVKITSSVVVLLILNLKKLDNMLFIY